MNLNQILALQIYVNGDSYLFSLLSLLPLIDTLSGGKLVTQNFYDMYQPIAYPFMEKWGMANCFLGEAYSNGRIFMVIVMVSVLCILFIITDKVIFSNKSPFIRLTGMAIMPYLAFYIHRNTWLFTIQTFKYFFMIGMLLYFMDLLFHCNCKKWTEPRRING